MYTAIIGGRDHLFDPTVLTPGCRYVCFTDEPLRSEVWEIVRVPSSEDPRRASRYYKMLPHRLFDAEYSLWVDGSFRLDVDVRRLIKRYLAQADIATFKHPERACLYEEAEAVLQFGLDDPEIVREQMRRYRAAGHPEQAGLSYCGVLLRRHTRTVRRLNEAWWREIQVGSIRDQLSFRYCARKLGVRLGVIEGEAWQSAEIPFLDHRASRRASEFEPDAWAKLVPPQAVSEFPADLGRPSLEFSGVYGDGWLDDSAVVGLQQPSDATRLVVRGMVPGIDDPAFTTEMQVHIDGQEIARRTLGCGDFELSEPIEPGAGRRQVRLLFSNGQLLPEQFPRRVTALARFIGFEPFTPLGPGEGVWTQPEGSTPTIVNHAPEERSPLAYRIVRKLGPLLGDGGKTILMHDVLGYWPNLLWPRTFNEKLVRRYLLATPEPLWSVVADKVRVRDYVARLAGPEILNEVYLVTDDPREIRLADLPDAFVVKANHGSGFNVLVRDKAAIDEVELQATCRSWLETSHATRFNERWYDQIPRKLIVERLLRDAVYDPPLDYKIWCFHGRARFVQIHQERFTDRHTQVIYDTAWRRQPFSAGFRLGPDVPRPSRLDDLLAIAERLSAGFGYVRVDLYCLNDRDIVFGEMTLAPGAGLYRFAPDRYDRLVGKFW